MSTEVTALLRSVNTMIDRTVKGKYDSQTQRTYICNTKWLRKGKRVRVGVNFYTITSISYNNWVTSVPVNPSNTTPLSGLIYIPEPRYFAGTKTATNREFTQIGNDMGTKTPTIWLLETFQQTNYGNGSPIEFESNVRLFFLDETDITNYTVQEHRNEVVKPMQELVNGFLETLNSTTGVKRVREYDMITFSRFGVERQEGMVQNVLDANLSGVELRFLLTKYKENCKLNC